MANYDQLNQELETLKSKFMLLDTDEERKAFRSDVTATLKVTKKNSLATKRLSQWQMMPAPEPIS